MKKIKKMSQIKETKTLEELAKFDKIIREDAKKILFRFEFFRYNQEFVDDIVNDAYIKMNDWFLKGNVMQSGKMLSFSIYNLALNFIKNRKKIDSNIEDDENVSIFEKTEYKEDDYEYWHDDYLNEVLNYLNWWEREHLTLSFKYPLKELSEKSGISYSVLNKTINDIYKAVGIKYLEMKKDVIFLDENKKFAFADLKDLDREKLEKQGFMIEKVLSFETDLKEIEKEISHLVKSKPDGYGNIEYYNYNSVIDCYNLNFEDSLISYIQSIIKDVVFLYENPVLKPVVKEGTLFKDYLKEEKRFQDCNETTFVNPSIIKFFKPNF